MNDLLAGILDAHGGTDRWNEYEKVEATIVSGGGLFALKGVPQDSSPRRMTVWLHEERSSVQPYGAPDQRTMFTPERIAVEKHDGTPVAERHAPRDSPFGPISPRPFFSRWTACGSRRPSRGGRVRRCGVSCAHTFRARSRRTASFRIFSSAKI